MTPAPSKTPLTDEEARCPRTNEKRGLVSVYFARALETKLAAERLKVERLREALWLIRGSKVGCNALSIQTLIEEALESTKI